MSANETQHRKHESTVVRSLFLVLISLISTGAVYASPSQAVTTFVSSDVVSQGNWQAKYGADGYSIASSNQALPSYASFATLNQSNCVWTNDTTDPRALQTITPPGRIASAWFNSSTFSLDVNLTDGKAHQVAIYALDWDTYLGGRVETIQVVDANSDTVLDTRQISAFTNGTYLVWNITGHVRINATMNAGGNAVISGIFFGGGASSASAAIASFVGLDTASQGNWQAKYGADGYSIASSNQALPSYASFATLNQANYVWTKNTTDPRALQTITPSGQSPPAGITVQLSVWTSTSPMEKLIRLPSTLSIGMPTWAGASKQSKSLMPIPIQSSILARFLPSQTELISFGTSPAMCESMPP